MICRFTEVLSIEQLLLINAFALLFRSIVSPGATLRTKINFGGKSAQIGCVLWSCTAGVPDSSIRALSMLAAAAGGMALLNLST
jgi:hypothetical protein